jgi:BirA family biotin operon repressor/biotin-[acetyl-CoA-carboxylase] ligase
MTPTHAAEASTRVQTDLQARWGLQALQQQLQALEPHIALEVLASVGSTNSSLLEQAAGASRQAKASGAAQSFHARLLVAESQTEGRGRQGRRWHASPGASLTFSLALTLAPQDWSGLSLAVGVALAQALDPAPQASVALKWPNDLWLRDASAPGGGRKLGGVLIETTGWASGGERVCVIGVGLNVQPQAVQEASSGVACLHEIWPEASAPAALARVAPALLQAARRFEREGFAGVQAAFAERDLLKGHAVTTTQAGLPAGCAEGVDATGALRVRAPDGTLHLLVGGEVSVRTLFGKVS